MRNYDIISVCDATNCSINQAAYLLLLTKENIQTAIELFWNEKLEAQALNLQILIIMKQNPNALFVISELSKPKSVTKQVLQQTRFIYKD